MQKHQNKAIRVPRKKLRKTTLQLAEASQDLWSLASDKYTVNALWFHFIVTGMDSTFLTFKWTFFLACLLGLEFLSAIVYPHQTHCSRGISSEEKNSLKENYAVLSCCPTDISGHSTFLPFVMLRHKAWYFWPLLLWETTTGSVPEAGLTFLVWPRTDGLPGSEPPMGTGY